MTLANTSQPRRRRRRMPSAHREAQKLGATMMLFGEIRLVRVLEIGSSGNCVAAPTWVCTGDIGLFKIVAEAGSPPVPSRGSHRRQCTGPWCSSRTPSWLAAAAAAFKAPASEVPGQDCPGRDNVLRPGKELAWLKSRLAASQGDQTSRARRTSRRQGARCS